MVILVLFILALSPGLSEAQEGEFAFHLRGGQNLPMGDFRDSTRGWERGVKPLPGFDLGFSFPFPGPFGLLLGFGQRRFACDGEVCPDDTAWVSTGFDAALRWVMGTGGLRSWLQGGIHTHRMEGRVLGEEGARRVTSDGAAGIEVGGGLLISLGERTSLSPGVRYGSARVPFPEPGDMTVRYLVVDLGLVMGF